ncbi:MAG: three-Cys-motif partner protein TcmP [Flammeovirgaceae bacterium]|jgi:three-Cys-motif partner protein|nr:three-Cys-motif partner protein TcmP [Flammeovirgaceae bacterium]
MDKFNSQIEVKPDGLYTPIVREWSLEKYRLVGSYCDIFTSGMKNKWNQLVYIDLFSGAGYAKIKENNKTYLNSALLAMSTPIPFTKYILCEQDDERYEALEKRVNRDFSHLNVELIKGDSNKNVSKVLKAIPPFGRGNTLLPFCFVDPYSLNLNFETIKSLGQTLMDFLILQALHMDGNRNFDTYLNDENTRIAEYLGISNWRELFEKDGIANRKDFVKFLATQYQEQMSKMGYQKAKRFHQIRSNEKNLPLYYLSFYSKHPTGEAYFKKIQQRVKPQLSMDL